MHHQMLSNVSIMVVLLAAITLSGCIIPPERQVARTWWHQPELWDAFPEDGEVDGYTITSTDLVVPGKSAVMRDRDAREVLGVTEDGDVEYSYVLSRTISTEQFRANMNRMFETLSLPEPTLDSAYELAYNHFQTKGIWNQPDVWDQFPTEGQEKGFDVHVHDSLKVAIKEDVLTSEWVRVNDTGVVNYKFGYRGGYQENGPYSNEERNATIWSHMESTFEDLSLPSPQLNQSHEFKPRAWQYPPDVRG